MIDVEHCNIRHMDQLWKKSTLEKIINFPKLIYLQWFFNGSLHVTIAGVFVHVTVAAGLLLHC